MKKLNQNGFIPLLVFILIVVVAVIVYVYLRIAHNQQ
jgi:hypothetical protein